MVYDPIGRRAILFGGMGPDGFLDDTWAYHPAANKWTRLAGSAVPSTGPPQWVTAAAAQDAAAKSLVRNAMTAIESGYVDLRTFDPAIMTARFLRQIEPSISFVAKAGDAAATAPTGKAAALTVDYFGTAATYAVGTVSESGRAFGIVVDKRARGGNTFYIDGVAQDW
jgi:hypothetical protein